MDNTENEVLEENAQGTEAKEEEHQEEKKETVIVEEPTLEGSEEEEEELGWAKSSWQKARYLVKELGDVPPLFFGAVSTLWKSNDAGKRKLTVEDVNKNHYLSILVRSPSYKAILYHAAMSIFPDYQLKRTHTPYEVISLFTPEELAAITASTYLYQQVSNLCPNKVWGGMSKEVQVQMEIGLVIGRTIEGVGAGIGLASGAIRYLSMALFATASSVREFVNYRTRLHKNDLLYDLDYEMSHWGCNHLQVSSILTQALGFGMSSAIGIAAGFKNEELPEELLNDTEALRWKAGIMWIDYLLEQLPEEPDCFPDDCFYPDRNALGDLVNSVDKIVDKGSSFSWIEKRRSDLEALFKSLEEEKTEVKEE